MGKQSLTGMLLMAACCGTPLLILLVLPLAGTALGGLGASALSTLAYLACPIGMALVMWMMMRGQQAGAPASRQAQPDLSAQNAGMASEPLPGAPVLQDRPNTNEAVELVTQPRRGSVRQPVPPTMTSHGQQAAVSTPERNGSQTATSSRA